MAREKDFLDEIIEESTEKNPRFPEVLEAAATRRRLLRSLGQKREELGLTQKQVAERMETSQSAVARMEAGEIDAKLSTVDRYAAAIGLKVEWQLVNNGRRSHSAGKSRPGTEDRLRKSATFTGRLKVLLEVKLSEGWSPLASILKYSQESRAAAAA